MSKYAICDTCKQEYDTEAPHDHECPGSPPDAEDFDLVCRQISDLERRVIALEDAHDVMQADVIACAKNAVELRRVQGLMTDIAGPARRVIEHYDGVPGETEADRAALREAVDRFQRDAAIPYDAGIMGPKTAAGIERAMIVKWLRERVGTSIVASANKPVADTIGWLSKLIERGDHWTDV